MITIEVNNNYRHEKHKKRACTSDIPNVAFHQQNVDNKPHLEHTRPHIFLSSFSSAGSAEALKSYV